MPRARARNPSPIPEVTWDTGLKEMNETWKGAIACLGVAVFFVMTIGIIYWQVVDQPNKNWILKGTFSGVIWERRSHALLIHTLSEDKSFVEIDVGDLGAPDVDAPFVRNLCWSNRTEFCYTWDAVAELKISVEEAAEESECYRVSWTPLRCQVELQDCFSMANVSWYGGAAFRTQTWPINAANATMQPFAVSNLREQPAGYGSVLERYFLGSSGVAVLVDPEVPLHVGFDSRRQFCLRTPPSAEQLPLQYTVCVGHNAKSVHQEVGRQLSTHKRDSLAVPLRLPFWKLPVNVDSGAKLERELRTFWNRLKRHHLGEGIIALNEHSTSLLADTDHESLYGKKKAKRQTRDLSLVKLLNISVTLSPFLSVSSRLFHASLQEGTEAYWLSLPAAPRGRPIPQLTQWKGKLCVKLNISNPAAVSWFLDRVGGLHARLAMEYVILEGGEGSPLAEPALHPRKALLSDGYIPLWAGVAASVGDTAIVTSGTRSSHVPLFIRMNPLQDDWSYSGLKGIIPSVLHHSLLGYNFFIPDAVGGSLSGESVADPELFIRWLEIVSFLPVMAFQSPPWLCGDDKVVDLTRAYLSLHREFIVPLVAKYAEEWRATRSPIYRPLWWIGPEDPITFTVEDEFLIGEEVLVAPVTEKGAVHRDIYLPGSGLKWQDRSNGQVFDGGTFLENYAVGVEDVAVFVQRRS
uniref:Si:ch211-236l14.4 n=1 Tax=Scleropages formosus TaxID=113540 RepID=A0A8C9W6M1_SCLFO